MLSFLKRIIFLKTFYFYTLGACLIRREVEVRQAPGLHTIGYTRQNLIRDP